ncbi:MAG: alpha/beta hydrolase-fold protein [Planctomycetota bacterium]|nr:alpha/beta hydrolase-fold protein [Planctomycetota bacterium]MDG1985206.1 alpha/beta hydrolase-fold protein [Planctomycetota bacterium]
MSGAQFRRDPSAFLGAVEARPFESEVLRDNALGDPHLREVPVYLPPAALDGEDLPVIFCLAGFTGRGQSMLETHPWKTGAALAYDRALAASGAPGCILVMPDAFTRLGGSQYVNSGATGRYADYVATELVAFVDSAYPTLAGARAVCGKSSGGFGALHLAMRYPGVFQAAASISGDCDFELPLGAEMVAAARALLPHDGNPGPWLEQFSDGHDLGGDGHAAINVLAMSACYAPNPESPLGFDLPFDPSTCARRADVWDRFLSFDPVVAAPDHADALRDLKLLYLEAGLKDEFGLQFGLRRLVRVLDDLAIPHRHVEHGGGHFGLDRRYAEVLPAIDHALRAQ